VIRLRLLLVADRRWWGVVQIRVTRETWNPLVGAAPATFGVTHKPPVLNHAAMAALALVLFPLITCRAGRLGRPAGRALLVVVRSTPEYMLAYVLLQVLGPSMLPANIALALHNGGIVGYLMGGHADELAYRMDAPRGLNLYFYETVPRLYGQFLAYVLYRWEIIVRESAIFGILGVPPRGYYVDAAISELRLDVAVVLIVAMGALSVAIDMFSRALRRRLRIDDRPVRLSTARHAQGVKAECA